MQGPGVKLNTTLPKLILKNSETLLLMTYCYTQASDFLNHEQRRFFLFSQEQNPCSQVSRNPGMQKKEVQIARCKGGHEKQTSKQS